MEKDKEAIAIHYEKGALLKSMKKLKLMISHIIQPQFRRSEKMRLTPQSSSDRKVRWIYRKLRLIVAGMDGKVRTYMGKDLPLIDQSGVCVGGETRDETFSQGHHNTISSSHFACQATWHVHIIGFTHTRI